jgi:hypothetical protein
MQPYCFPYIGYFQLVNAVETFIFLDDVSFIKQGWINRNRILINGEPGWIIFPCQKISSYKSIKDTKLLGNESWKNKELRKIELAYRRAPFFGEVMPLLEKCFFCGHDDIASFASFGVIEVMNYLGTKPQFMWTSETFGETLELGGAERLIAILRQNNAEMYVNPIGGKSIYSRDEFERAGIELRFLKSDETIQYRQFREDNFVPWLSIIDVLMFNERKAVRSLLSKFSLVE